MKIIPQDILDTDFYTHSMDQLIFNQFPNAIVKYRYKNRSADLNFRSNFDKEVKQQIEFMSSLKMTDSMVNFFKKNAPVLKPTYLQWLSSFRFKPEQVNVSMIGSELNIEITGPWFETIFWEEPLLYIISELYRTDPKTGLMTEKDTDWQDKIKLKAERLAEAGVNWIEFGTRRRFSSETQDAANRIMKQYSPHFRGTSNPYFANKHNINVIGTFAHQLPMAMQSLYGVQQCNIKAMEHWISEYRGNLGIALTDTITTNKFLDTFDSYFARVFDGVRQDSGDPIEVGNKIINHYQKLGIDPTSKTIIFSDSLNVDRAIMIHKAFKGRIKTVMGIGTNITNDVGVKPINHVIKLVSADFGEGMKDVVKLSDTEGKAMGGSQEAIDNALKILKIKGQ